MFEVENVDGFISVWGQQNTKALTEISPERQTWKQQARKRYLDRFLERAAEGNLKWVGIETGGVLIYLRSGESLSSYSSMRESYLILCRVA